MRAAGRAEEDGDQVGNAQPHQAEAGDRDHRILHAQREDETSGGEPAGQTKETRRTEPPGGVIAAEPARGHRQRERGEASGRNALARPSRVHQVHRAPVADGALGQERTERQHAEAKQAAGRLDEYRRRGWCDGDQRAQCDQDHHGSEQRRADDVIHRADARGDDHTAQPGAGQAAHAEQRVER